MITHRAIGRPTGAAVVLAMGLLGACAGDSSSTRGTAGGDPGPGSDVAAAAGPEDRDGDGLCDVTEQASGSDADDPNTDGDALPDVFEVAYGFDATDPRVPAADQVGYLEARPGATLDFSLRTTVEGDGQGHTGLFRAQGTIYADELTADTFFVRSVAVSADPADNVRGVEYDSSRFGSIVGATRLGFSLRFEFPRDMEPEGCARAYPFRYALKGDDGESRARRRFVLVVAPDGATGADGPWCPPSACY